MSRCIFLSLEEEIIIMAEVILCVDRTDCILDFISFNDAIVTGSS
jgi:hypothetical protein